MTASHLLAAPHRAWFFSGVIMLLLSSLYWAGQLLLPWVSRYSLIYLRPRIDGKPG